MNNEPVTGPGGGRNFLGSLREALAAAGRDEPKTDEKKKMEATAQSRAATRTSSSDKASSEVVQQQIAAPTQSPPRLPVVASPDNAVQSAAKAVDAGIVAEQAVARLETVPQSEDAAVADGNANAGEGVTRQSAAEAARQARGELEMETQGRHIEMDEPKTQPSSSGSAKSSGAETAPPRTQLVRGKAKVGREGFDHDPVVGWLVVVGGPGLGSFRPIFEGNNTIGRSSSQRIAIDFGDEAISSEEQAYIRYDSMDRSFLFVPNLAKTNVVQVNHQKPTSAVSLSGMDVITMGRTQLVFVPFCSAEFDWSELSDLKE